MENTTPIILLIIAMIGIILYLYFKVIRKTKYRDSLNRVLNITNKVTLPSGLTLLIEKNVSTPTDAEISAIERGLIACFTKAAALDYNRPLQLSEYQVAIFGNVERSPEAKLWCYKLPAGPYINTEWDMGGYILAAGETVAVGTPYGNIIAIPDHKGTDLDQLALICEYEAEHVILAYCDGDKFEATKIHGQGQGHPLF